MLIRDYRISDNDEIATLFFETVHSINAQDYSPSQIDAWAPKGMDADVLCSRLSRNHTIVAESDGEIVGFASIDTSGCFDLLYIRKDHQREGIARQLSETIEEHARKCGTSILHSYVSISAVPFFLSQGYRIEQKNVIERNGVKLHNYKMLKPIL